MNFFREINVYKIFKFYMSEKFDPFWTVILADDMAENNDKDVANGHHLNNKNEQSSTIGKKSC